MRPTTLLLALPAALLLSAGGEALAQKKPTSPEQKLERNRAELREINERIRKLQERYVFSEHAQVL